MKKLNLAVILMAAALAMACSFLDSESRVPNELNPTPYNPGEPVGIGEIWEESQPQKGELSGGRYRNRWVIIKVDSVNVATSGGVLMKQMPSPPNTVHFEYNYDEQAEANRGQQNFLVLCNVGGVSSGGASLVMHHCRPTDIDGKPVDPK